MPDPDAPKAKEAKKEEDIGEMWVKFWNMDPENYIWGIDPNEAPPEVRREILWSLCAPINVTYAVFSLLISYCDLVSFWRYNVLHILESLRTIASAGKIY